MNFKETMLKGAYVLEQQPAGDERGFFARTWCQEELREHGLNPNLAQCNLSYNRKRGTLRGMHYQARPHAEAKIVWCMQGSIYDVIVDLRPASSTYGQWLGIELTANNHKMLYIPEDFAHGFQALEDETHVFYWMSEFYHPELARGLRYDDPGIGIRWPIESRRISPRDLGLPYLR